MMDFGKVTMLRTIIWYTCFWLLQLLSVFFLALYFVFGLAGMAALQKKYLHWTTRTWARLLIAIAGGRIEVLGLENLPASGGILFVANHPGAFDIPLLLGYVPGLKGFVSKKENSRLPIVGIWMKLLRCIFIDRRDLRQTARAIARGISDLRSGRSLIIFPEGTRSKSGVMNRFKGGSFKLATRSEAAIVPLTIDGSFRLLEGNRGRIMPGRVRLHIHPVIRVQDLDAAAKGALPETVRRIIASALAV
ncbi:MAG TPA: lysophospholipid acyltransferase family protein [Candidatus Binatia bacterium]|nr:lysophospholipid acyltransferase family protein [Candidatus Binatia bacterium]